MIPDLEDSGTVAAIQKVILEYLYYYLGYVSTNIAHCLILNNLVTGLYIVFLSKENIPFFCKLCVYAKTTYKSVLEEKERKKAKEFREKIHSDVWSLVPTEILGEK